MAMSDMIFLMTAIAFVLETLLFVVAILTTPPRWRRLNQRTVHVVMTLLLPLICLVCTVSIAKDAVACDAAAAAATSARPLRPYSTKTLRAAQILASATEPVLLVGDSITRQWPDAERFEDLGIPTFNFGADGDESGNVLYRLALTTAPLKFRSIVILIGTNQLRAQGACGAAAGVASVVKALRERAPTASMVVVSILPRGTLSNEVREANELLAAGSGYKYADAWTPFVARCPAVDVECALLTDGLHLTREGYRVLGTAIRNAL
jgi:lysophospholipase L1-like esterase